MILQTITVLVTAINCVLATTIYQKCIPDVYHKRTNMTSPTACQFHHSFTWQP